MSWLLAVLGFVLLVILHELGHFTAAKAVGMRVERFSLFFPPLLFRKQIGETEYAIGAIPAGGYVKISGMNPSEDLPDEVRTRAYHAQPVWKRIVVILAGPAVNLVLAFVLMVVFFGLVGAPSANVAGVRADFPAHGAIMPGDVPVSVDGHRGAPQQLSKQITTHTCAVRPPVNGCRGTTPATVVVNRHGHLVTLHLTPEYDGKAHRMLLGFTYGDTGPRKQERFGSAISDSTSYFWFITHVTASLPVRIFNAQDRKQISGIVGTYERTRQTIVHDPADVVRILAVISLSLAIVNLFPFLPLDGGHIFWALAEFVRRRPISYSTMERSGIVGFGLVLMLFVLGLSNDIGTLSHGGFGPGR